MTILIDRQNKLKGKQLKSNFGLGENEI